MVSVQNGPTQPLYRMSRASVIMQCIVGEDVFRLRRNQSAVLSATVGKHFLNMK